MICGQNSNFAILIYNNWPRIATIYAYHSMAMNEHTTRSNSTKFSIAHITLERALNCLKWLVYRRFYLFFTLESFVGVSLFYSYMEGKFNKICSFSTLGPVPVTNSKQMKRLSILDVGCQNKSILVLLIGISWHISNSRCKGKLFDNILGFENGIIKVFGWFCILLNQ